MWIFSPAVLFIWTFCQGSYYFFKEEKKTSMLFSSISELLWLRGENTLIIILPVYRAPLGVDIWLHCFIVALIYSNCPRPTVACSWCTVCDWLFDFCNKKKTKKIETYTNRYQSMAMENNLLFRLDLAE